MNLKTKKNATKNLSEKNKVELKFSKSNSKGSFLLSVAVNEVKKVNPDLNLNLLPQQIDVASWEITSSSTWDHLLRNIILSLKLNTVKYKVEIVGKNLKSKLNEKDNNKKLNFKIIPKKGKEKSIIATITLFNIKQGKEKTIVFDKLYNKTQQIGKK